jgi:hypothetical protein
MELAQRLLSANLRPTSAEQRGRDEEEKDVVAHTQTQAQAQAQAHAPVTTVAAAAVAQARRVVAHLTMLSDAEARSRLERKRASIAARVSDLAAFREQLVRVLHERRIHTQEDKSFMQVFIERFAVVGSWHEPVLVDLPASNGGRQGVLYITSSHLCFHATNLWYGLLQHALPLSSVASAMDGTSSSYLATPVAVAATVKGGEMEGEMGKEKMKKMAEGEDDVLITFESPPNSRPSSPPAAATALAAVEQDDLVPASSPISTKAETPAPPYARSSPPGSPTDPNGLLVTDLGGNILHFVVGSDAPALSLGLTVGGGGDEWALSNASRLADVLGLLQALKLAPNAHGDPDTQTAVSSPAPGPAPGPAPARVLAGGAGGAVASGAIAAASAGPSSNTPAAAATGNPTAAVAARSAAAVEQSPLAALGAISSWWSQAADPPIAAGSGAGADTDTDRDKDPSAATTTATAPPHETQAAVQTTMVSASASDTHMPISVGVSGLLGGSWSLGTSTSSGPVPSSRPPASSSAATAAAAATADRGPPKKSALNANIQAFLNRAQKKPATPTAP